MSEEEGPQSGWTPLHYAALCGFERMAAILVAHGADPNAESQWGATPLDVARQQERADVAAFLAPITTAPEDPNARWRLMQGPAW
ncbi:MAG: ankyrin repeat domain-containing protein [Sedimentisphaerales bacterium]|nr:ankyrin repeat domain-containing protein [Sedimentisphaerales bacterium]